MAIRRVIQNQSALRIAAAAVRIGATVAAVAEAAQPVAAEPATVTLSRDEYLALVAAKKPKRKKKKAKRAKQAK